MQPATAAAAAAASAQRLRDDSHAAELAATVATAGVKLVCIDFDATFVSVHTGGTWTRTAEELRVHVRGLFLSLVPLLLDASVSVAVVTFSPQVALIRSVLALCWDSAVTERLIVRCDDPSWRLEHTELLDFAPLWQVTGMHFDRKYKLPYVVSAARQASERRGELIRNHDTILLDDDAKNVRIAIDNGISGVYFEPEGCEPAELCRRIRKLHAPAPSQPPPLHTPSKRKHVRVLETPEAPHRVSHRTPTVVASMPRSKKFSMCTPSPVMKMKTTVEMGRPRSKKALRMRRSPRSIEGDMHALFVVPEAASPPVPATPPAPSTPPPRLPLPFALPASPRSPECRYGAVSVELKSAADARDAV